MVEKNLGIAIAKEAVASIKSLNTTRSIEIYEKIRLAKEENDETAKAQKIKALPHGLSAGLSIICSLAATFFNEQTKWYISLNAAAKALPSAAATSSSWLDGAVTTHSYNTKISDVAQQRISQYQNTNDSLISRHVEQIGRLLSKEI